MDNTPTIEFVGEPLDVFARLQVFVAFDSDHRDRRPVEEDIPGHPGIWICAYSSLPRLQEAHHRDDVEYSRVTGAMVLALLPEHTGLWFDHTYPGGRQLLLPPVEVTTDLW